MASGKVNKPEFHPIKSLVSKLGVRKRLKTISVSDELRVER
jgi:hypothetical protein